MKKYSLYDGERYIQDMSYIESVKFSGVSRPTFAKRLEENSGVFQKNNYFIVRKNSKAEMMYMLELTRFFIKGSYNPDKLLPEVKNFYKKISLTI